jgi:hypothetical protein
MQHRAAPPLPKAFTKYNKRSPPGRLPGNLIYVITLMKTARLSVMITGLFFLVRSFKKRAVFLIKINRCFS